MSGYSKMTFFNTNKPKSVEFSDDFYFPQPAKPNSLSPNPISKIQETTQTLDLFTEKEDEDGHGEKVDVFLSRNYFVSSTSSHSFKFDKEITSLPHGVKRAFSMRSSSVSERYSRIHDQPVELASPFGDEGMQTRSVKKKKRGNVLKACKRLFGL